MEKLTKYLQEHLTSRMLRLDKTDNDKLYQDLMVKTATLTNKEHIPLSLKFL